MGLCWWMKWQVFVDNNKIWCLFFSNLTWMNLQVPWTPWSSELCQDCVLSIQVPPGYLPSTAYSTWKPQCVRGFEKYFTEDRHLFMHLRGKCVLLCFVFTKTILMKKYLLHVTFSTFFHGTVFVPSENS